MTVQGASRSADRNSWRDLKDIGSGDIRPLTTKRYQYWLPNRRVNGYFRDSVGAHPAILSKLAIAIEQCELQDFEASIESATTWLYITSAKLMSPPSRGRPGCQAPLKGSLRKNPAWSKTRVQFDLTRARCVY